jgi:hypothetical protein
MKLGYALTVLALGLLFLPGCALFNSVDLTYQRHTTIGQELMDLETAKKKGAITKREYDRVRAEILKGGPVPDMKDEDD